MYLFSPSISAWSRVALSNASPSPCARGVHSLTLFSGRKDSDDNDTSISTHYFIGFLFGGRNASDAGMDDLWVFRSDLSSWRLVEFASNGSSIIINNNSSSTSGRPKARWGHVCAVAGNSSLVMYGGLSRASPSAAVAPVDDDLWLLQWSYPNNDDQQWPIVTWTRIQRASGSAPGAVPRGLCVFVAMMPDTSFTTENLDISQATLVIAGGWDGTSDEAMATTFEGRIDSVSREVTWTPAGPAPQVAGASFSLVSVDDATISVILFRGVTSFGKVLASPKVGSER